MQGPLAFRLGCVNSSPHKSHLDNSRNPDSVLRCEIRVVTHANDCPLSVRRPAADGPGGRAHFLPPSSAFAKGLSSARLIFSKCGFGNSLGGKDKDKSNASRTSGCMRHARNHKWNGFSSVNRCTLDEPSKFAQRKLSFDLFRDVLYVGAAAQLAAAEPRTPSNPDEG